MSYESLDPFPESDADKIIEYANKVGERAVEDMINTIRDTFGHPEAIETRVDAWGFHAKQKLDQSLDSISNCRADLSAYWQGGAYDSFTIYLDHLEGIFQTAVDVFKEMSEHLKDIASTMTDVYNEGISFIYTCAGIIVEAMGGFASGITELFFGVAEVICDAIADFVRKCGETITVLNTAISEYRRTGQSLLHGVTDIRVPETIPQSSVDIGGWNVRDRVTP
ncbi:MULTISPECIES: hypothetical protein [Actinoalloteichus]|uniref:WXG repeat protein n=1 Tax=Actinoalloteichus fjordicus TaxID=1612552 RepID=A0AAC9LH57_9PSEU|nr:MULTISPECIES: hypothetical protein [Actinoalloteichus]APU16800.1 WXG repeat protein [Actinoalloteichus fjordicus]APU22865.1 WXG repeat protein [Actinoalloteichus sp. GBA129-24]